MVVAVVWATGSIHTLAGVPSAIGITAAIVCGLFGGRVSGGVVESSTRCVFLTLAASSGNDMCAAGWSPHGGLVVCDRVRNRRMRPTTCASDWIERSRELRRANESAEFVASSLQQSLLPERLPEIPGVEIGTWFRPAGDGRIVGGDFFDVWRVNPERFGAVIGDVCGKGPTAAAVTALARHTIRTASMLDQSPADTLRVVNDAVRRRTGAGQFCTALAVMGRAAPRGVRDHRCLRRPFTADRGSCHRSPRNRWAAGHVTRDMGRDRCR